MRDLVPGFENIKKICGRQKIKDGVQYRSSRFCMRLPCDSGTLLYHTMTGELLLLEPGENADNCSECLIKAWFMVPEMFDEMRHLSQIRQLLALTEKKKNISNFTILTTTDCNARCFYCYEMGVNRCPMSLSTAHEVASYIRKNSGGETVSICWFGGEPLFNRGAIETICRDLRENQVTFKSRMITNGFYLDEKTAQIAKTDWHLSTVQITLDGTRDVYNGVKAYINRSDDAFARVLGNIDTAMDAGINVSIRLNVDENNAQDILQLADELTERFGPRKEIHVYPALLESFSAPVHDFETEEEKRNLIVKLFDKLLESGLYKAGKLPERLRRTSCMADDDRSVVILPDGRMTKCEHIDIADVVGSIHDDSLRQESLEAWKKSVQLPECADCALYPQCISLEKCPWVKEHCGNARRTLKLRQMEARICEAYRKAVE